MKERDVWLLRKEVLGWLLCGLLAVVLTLVIARRLWGM